MISNDVFWYLWVFLYLSEALWYFLGLSRSLWENGGECFAPHSHGSERAPRFKPRESVCELVFFMVRSTLPQLALRGALRALLGGPLVTGFFRLQPTVFPIKNSSRKKSFFVSRVSNHEDFDFLCDFSVRARDLVKHERCWTTFWHILGWSHEKSMKFKSESINNQQ